MKITHVQQIYGADLQKASGNPKAASKTEKVKKGDVVSVSKEGSSLSKTNASAEATTKRVNSLPEIRWDKVEAVKQKVAEGFYNTSKFRDELADKLIKDFGIGPA